MKFLTVCFLIVANYFNVSAQSKSELEGSLAMQVATEMAEGSYFQCSAYINADFGFFLRFPASWGYQEKYKDHLVYAYSNSNTNDNFSVCSISILQDTLNSNIDTSALAQLVYMKSAYTLTQEPTIKKITIRGVDFRKISISTKIEKQNLNMDVYLALKNHYYYIVNFTTCPNKENSFSSDQEKIINSFTIGR